MGELACSRFMPSVLAARGKQELTNHELRVYLLSFLFTSSALLCVQVCNFVNVYKRGRVVIRWEVGEKGGRVGLCVKKGREGVIRLKILANS